MASNAALGSNMKNGKKVCLFYCAEMKDLAERVAAESDAIELRSITWRWVSECGYVLFYTSIQICMCGFVSVQLSKMLRETMYFQENICIVK